MDAVSGQGGSEVPRISDMLIITLPYPPMELSPNARLHWSKISKVKKRYRFECFIEAKRQGIKPVDRLVESVKIHLLFFPPDARHRDQDNMEASCKSLLDGLADAMKVNDRLFSISKDVSLDKLNKVEVTIT